MFEALDQRYENVYSENWVYEQLLNDFLQTSTLMVCCGPSSSHNSNYYDRESYTADFCILACCALPSGLW